jgi:hypothetical protein
MLNTIDLMALNAKYQKYRPNVPIKENVRKWWKFAYTAITETQIRPKKEQFKWDHIKMITRTRRDYVNLLKKKHKSGKLSTFEMEQEKQCEEVLDVFNLVLSRKQADVEIARIAQETAKSSWWNWMTSSTSSKEDRDKISEAVSLSQEEKAKLYEAIGYSGEESYSGFPDDVTSCFRNTYSLNFLNNVKLNLEVKTSKYFFYIFCNCNFEVLLYWVIFIRI